MREIVEFDIEGEPIGKARPRHRQTAGKSITYTPKKTLEYEEKVRNSFLSKNKGVKFGNKSQIGVIITSYFKIPKNKAKRVRELMLAGIIKPTKKPDIDNIAKIICDGLNGVAYKDDAQIIYLAVMKRYAEEGSVRVKMWEVENG